MCQYWEISNRMQCVSCLVLEHIQIFQEPLFSHRTDTHFPGKPYLVLEHIRFSRRSYPDTHFPGRYPRRTDISIIGLGGCFRKHIKLRDKNNCVYCTNFRLLIYISGFSRESLKKVSF